MGFRRKINGTELVGRRNKPSKLLLTR